ncbi:MAG TPA: pyridoxal-phosphate dependent enzyme [Candidatus Limnocylindria bacterium]|nr:pyridoxal-phosphate dependent enzyme [Candidatus Limnocylindria bacterium]
MLTINPPMLDDVLAARERIADLALRTPLIPLSIENAPAPIYLKLENLQPIGSFKLRGAANAMMAAGSGALTRGVLTASAGNMAQGVAWTARRLGVPCTVLVPDRAPEIKLAAIERLGARVVKLPFEEWWQTLVTHRVPRDLGRFIHPVCDRAVIAGNGTIGLEILEDLPDVETIVVPYGGGGLSCGIGTAVKALRPQVKLLACEVETATPLTTSLAAGMPAQTAHVPSFVDGIGAPSLLEEMWPMVRRLIDGAVVVSLAEVAAAIRLLVERAHVVAEGAGAASVAAALAGRAGTGPIVCVVSGGNLDREKLVAILAGEVPGVSTHRDGAPVAAATKTNA